MPKIGLAFQTASIRLQTTLKLEFMFSWERLRVNVCCLESIAVEHHKLYVIFRYLLYVYVGCSNEGLEQQSAPLRHLQQV